MEERERKASAKDWLIFLLLAVIVFLGAFCWQSQYFIDQLNTENERLQAENERILHLLRLSTGALQHRKGDMKIENHKTNSAPVRDIVGSSDR